MTIGAFTYKGIRSTDFGIISKSTDRSLLPGMRSNMAQIPGRDGSIDLGDNTYDNRQIKVHIAFKEKDYEQLRKKAREIAGWLSSDKYEKLIFDDEEDKYYLARIYNEMSFNSWFKLGEADLIFDCQPFAYSEERFVVSENITSLREIEITNNGTYKAYPLIEVTGTAGSVTLASDGGSFAIKNITEKTIVDCQNQLCYTFDGLNLKVNKLKDFTGLFICLKPGTLKVAVSGVALNINVRFTLQDVYL